MTKFRTRLLLLGLAAAIAAPGAAIAHHGWSWTEDRESELSGMIETIELGNPHARVTLRTPAGVWRVDLAPPSSTAAAGFVAGVAKTGDRASVTGHRSKDPNERAFKAETITVNGQTYDVYPNRPKTLKPGS